MSVLAADEHVVDRHDLLRGGQEAARARVRPDSHLGGGGRARARHAGRPRLLRVEVQQENPPHLSSLAILSCHTSAIAFECSPVHTRTRTSKL